MNDEPCTRGHLQAVQALLTFSLVDDDGNPTEEVFVNDDLCDVESYLCDNCHESWEVSDWQAALDHLKVEEDVTL